MVSGRVLAVDGKIRPSRDKLLTSPVQQRKCPASVPDATMMSDDCFLPLFLQRQISGRPTKESPASLRQLVNGPGANGSSRGATILASELLAVSVSTEEVYACVIMRLAFTQGSGPIDLVERAALKDVFSTISIEKFLSDDSLDPCVGTTRLIGIYWWVATAST